MRHSQTLDTCSINMNYTGTVEAATLLLAAAASRKPLGMQSHELAQVLAT
jgi:hypothetical protein